ncbi:hypothetical protein [Zooshikella sp. RANM57]|uniref:hypothetical protein n=1 Tax=Zooshikella sp. RANM57 TaxID=3425863 RepID=UPI003D700278
MPDILIKDVNVSLEKKLISQAAVNNRSCEDEIKAILNEAMFGGRPKKIPLNEVLEELACIDNNHAVTNSNNNGLCE